MLSPILPLDAAVGAHHQVRYSKVGAFFVYDVKAGAAQMGEVYGEPGAQSYVKYCRTEIAWLWERANYKAPLRAVADIVPYLGYYMVDLDAKSFGARWYDLESTLKLAARSTFHPTNAGHSVILHLSPFWLANDTRRSLLTLFMRMLAVHPKASLTEAIDLDPLASKTKRAIEWFLAGNTLPTYAELSRKENITSGTDIGRCYTGWYSEMINLSPDEIAAKLVKEIGP